MAYQAHKIAQWKEFNEGSKYGEQEVDKMFWPSGVKLVKVTDSYYQTPATVEPLIANDFIIQV